MNRQEIQVPIGGDGNGWVSTGVPFDKYVSSYVEGPAPQRDGYWPIASTAANNTDGNAEIARHQKEFDYLFLLARRGELSEPEAEAQ